MGCGFLEAVYQECLELEFASQGIPFVAHPWLELAYKDTKLQQELNPDFICFGRVVVEIKAKEAFLDRCQTLNYLNSVKMPHGLLINFGHYPKVEYERIAFTRSGR